MKIELSAKIIGGDIPFIEIEDEQTPEGKVGICVDEWPGCEGSSAWVEITRDDALTIVNQLKKVFNL